MTLWLCSTLASAVLALLMIYTGQWRRWPALFAFLAIVSIEYPVLLALWRSHAYLLVYWAFSLALEACEVFLLIEIACELVGPIEPLRRILRQSIPGMAVVLLGAFGVLSFSEPWPAEARLAWCASHYDTAVSLALLVTVTGIIAAASLGKIQFSHGVRPIVAGLFIESMCTCVVSFLSVYFPQIHNLEVWKSCCFTLCLLIWFFSFAPALRCFLRLGRPGMSYEKRSIGSCS